MKKILIFLILIGITSNAQTIVPRYQATSYGMEDNTYYKDIDDFQNQYIGTWLYTNGTTSLKITFNKLIKYFNNTEPFPHYEDYLVGEYQYIENGVEKANTYYQPSGSHPISPYLTIFDYNLYSKSRIPKTIYPKCDECAINEYRLVLNFQEPSRLNIFGLLGELVIRRIDDGGPKLIARLVCRSSGYGFDKDGNSVPEELNDFTLPYGEYILVKQ